MGEGACPLGYIRYIAHSSSPGTAHQITGKVSICCCKFLFITFEQQKILNNWLWQLICETILVFFQMLNDHLPIRKTWLLSRIVALKIVEMILTKPKREVPSPTCCAGFIWYFIFPFVSKIKAVLRLLTHPVQCNVCDVTFFPQLMEVASGLWIVNTGIWWQFYLNNNINHAKKKKIRSEENKMRVEHKGLQCEQ